MFNRRYAYIYDKIGRIQEARNSQTGRSETFAFDPAHNILSDKAAEGKDGNPVSGNRLKEYNGIEYTYDVLGNLIYRQLPDGENQYYQYDLENQLVRAEIKKPAGNTEIWTYAYDPFGRRLSKERQDKLAWTSTDPKRTHFVWDGTRLLQEYTYKGSYTYIYTDQDSYEPLAQVFDNAKDGKQYIAYFHNDQIGISREMTDINGNLLWYGEYTAWGRLKKDERVYKNAHQPFRLQNQYFDEETGLHYNLMRYYEPEAGRFVNQDPIGLAGGENFYQFSPNTQSWIDPLGWIYWKKGTPKPPGWRLPKDGTWAGSPGHSPFTPNNPSKLGLHPGDTIKYRGGRPDFSPWAATPWSSSGKGPKGFKVTGMTGDAKADKARMTNALAQKMGWTVQDTKAYLRRNNLILHHSSRNTAQLIPESLHDGIRHTGPASVMRNKRPNKRC